MKVFIDIETIPCQRPDVLERIKAGISAPANYKDPAKIAAYIAEAAPEKIAQTALNGLWGEVWCIGWAVNSEPVYVRARENLEHSEADLLREWVKDMRGAGLCNPDSWVGHNVGWDLRFLWQRLAINGIGHNIGFALDSRPWDSLIVDTMTLWAGKDRVKLSDLAMAFGLSKSDGMNGAEVWPAVQRGEYERVAEYCRQDVEITRHIYNRIK